MKSTLFIVSIVGVLFITSCHKHKQVEKHMGSGPPGWVVKLFLVNDEDKTDSLLSLINTSGNPPWGVYFSPDYTLAGEVHGTWAFSEEDATEIRITAYNSTSAQVGPLIGNGVAMFWNFNVDKLLDDDEIWISNNKYEVHLRHY